MVIRLYNYRCIRLLGLITTSLLISLPVQAEIRINNACHFTPDNATGKPIPDIKLHTVAEGLDSPVGITHAGDGSGRLFVVEQSGRIRVINNDQLQKEVFLDISHKLVDGGERGLLGLAFHPSFARNGRFYINYTVDSEQGLHTIVSELRVQQHRINIDQERILLQIQQPWSNHNGGQLAFGPDGYLYIAVGDGGSANDPYNNGQNLNTLLGNILRINVNKQENGKAYAIPKDNPFIKTANARAEIWAYGLRNPWRFSFDRLNGQLYAADVGQDAVEEINIIQKGGNYGWRVMEGDICTPEINRHCDTAPYAKPLYTYRHDIGRSITGGYVYRGKQFPELCGTYLYGDFVSQAIWGLRITADGQRQHKTLFSPKSIFRLAIDYFDDDGLLISSFGEDESGEIYVAAYQSGRIYRITRK